jgi:hypothetical protein
MSETLTPTRSGGRAVLKRYCAVFGYHETPVRKFTVYEVEPRAQYDRSVMISWVEPRKRSSEATVIVPNDYRFMTIEVDGETVYDSRIDIPCDMDKWKVTHAEHTGENRCGRMIVYAPDGSIRSDSANDPDPEPPEFPAIAGCAS